MNDDSLVQPSPLRVVETTATYGVRGACWTVTTTAQDGDEWLWVKPAYQPTPDELRRNIEYINARFEAGVSCARIP